jgi:hypothetical protein
MITKSMITNMGTGTLTLVVTLTSMVTIPSTAMNMTTLMITLTNTRMIMSTVTVTNTDTTMSMDTLTNMAIAMGTKLISMTRSTLRSLIVARRRYALISPRNSRKCSL